MTVEAQVCPQCGSAVQFNNGQTSVVCAYCGTTVTLSATSDALLKKEMEEERIIKDSIHREARLFQNGQPTTAKVLIARSLDIKRGERVMMSFTLEVHPKDEAAFNASTTALIGLAAMDKYQLGAVLDVAYDPQDHTQVSIEGLHGLMTGPYQLMRKGAEQMREGDEMMSQADAESDQADKEMDAADQEIAQADEKLQKLKRKKK